MKFRNILIFALSLVFSVSCQSANHQNGQNQQSNTMKSLFMSSKSIEFDSFRLEIHGMSALAEVYAGEKTEKGVHLEYFLSRKSWDDSINDYSETKMMVHAIDGGQQLYDEVCQLFSECRIDKWDGFSAKNPHGVYDGSMMNFMATLSDGSTIFASGSNNFPKNYGEFKSALRKMTTTEKITSQEFHTQLFSITVPDSWVNVVSVEFRESHLAFTIPQTNGEQMTMLLIDQNNYGYYESSNESSTNIGKLVDNRNAENTCFIDFRDYYGFKSDSELLTKEAKSVAVTYKTDKQSIIESFKPADGYNFIKIKEEQ